MGHMVVVHMELLHMAQVVDMVGVVEYMAS